MFDEGHHRVLIWNTIPTTNGQPADLVLGQSDFTNNASNDDGQTGVVGITSTARTLYNPYGVFTIGR